MMSDNWYLILELDFDPPVEDEQKISQRIEEKAKFWASHSQDFKMGAQYRLWHQNVSKIKKDMIGPENIRKQLASDACTTLYEPIDKLLKTIGRKGNITTEEAEKIATKLKVSVEIVKKRATKLGIKTINNTNYQAVYDKYYKNKPQGFAGFDNMLQMLKAFNVDNLYDFLYNGTEIKNANRLPCDKLRIRAQEKKKNEFYKTDPKSGTGSKLCGQCEVTFKDENSKEAYDVYLEYVKRKSILDYAKSVSEISGELTPELADETIGKLTQIFRDRKTSEDLLVAFCKIEKIPYKSSEPPKNIKVCRCGCINDISDGRKVCSDCGLELTIKCPKCGEENDANTKVCKCGFRFENIDKALALCEQAEFAIDTLDFKIAKAHLSDAEHYWPGSSKVKDLIQKLKEYETRVGKEVGKMREAVENKCFFEAKKQYDAIKKLFSGYSDPKIESEINDAITKAQSLLSRAKATKIDKEILELCAQAYDICADLPGVRELMPPPSEVTGFSVFSNSTAKANIISWNVTNDKSLKYVVIRSKAGWVNHVADGDVIFRGSASSYFDKDIEPGVSYYYNVFAERAGVYSKGAKGEFKENINLFEISGVGVAAADRSLNISWDKLPLNATAEIYMISDNGGEKLISSSTSDSYLITKLVNEKQYNFTVKLSYFVSGKKECTKGVQVIGTPTCPPMPIDTLRVKKNQSGGFDAIWVQTDGSDVRLYGSENKPSHGIGEVLSLTALQKDMKPLQHLPLSGITASTLKSDEKGVSFQYSGNNVLYVAAITVKAESAVFGSIARASTDENVNIKSIRPVNGKIHIYLDAPKNATGFVVLYRFDKYPEDISDVKTIRKHVPIKQYQLNSAIILDSLEEKKYYFSVFAEFRRDGEYDYSSGSDYLFDNTAKTTISYSIIVNKKLLGASSIVLEFESEQTSFILPAIDIMSTTGHAPMFKSSAKQLYSIEEQQVNGTIQIRIPMPKDIQRDTYIKAFFHDESDQSNNQLKLKLKSSYKIS